MNFITSFINDLSQMILHPGNFFSEVNKKKGVLSSLIRGFVFGVLACGIWYIWDIVNWSSNNFKSIDFINVSAYWFPLYAIGLHIFIALLLIFISWISQGVSSFFLNYQMASYIMVFFPLLVLFRFIYRINIYWGIVISTIVLIYMILLFYLALIKGLNAKPIGVIIICFFLFLFVGYTSYKTIQIAKIVISVLPDSVSELDLNMGKKTPLNHKNEKKDRLKPDELESLMKKHMYHYDND